jgi:hypothetical protein
VCNKSIIMRIIDWKESMKYYDIQGW